MTAAQRQTALAAKAKEVMRGSQILGFSVAEHGAERRYCSDRPFEK
jgi:hypothetical protein